MSPTCEVTLRGTFSSLLEDEITNVEKYYMALKTIINATTEEVVGVRQRRHSIGLSAKIENGCEKRIKAQVKMINCSEGS